MDFDDTTGRKIVMTMNLLQRVLKLFRKKPEKSQVVLESMIRFSDSLFWKNQKIVIDRTKRHIPKEMKVTLKEIERIRKKLKVE